MTSWWHDEMRDAAPDIVCLSNKRIKIRKMRKVNCGHVAMPGEVIQKWVGIIDGEFTVDEGPCSRCEMEAAGYTLEDQSEDSLEQTEEDRKHTEGTPWENA